MSSTSNAVFDFLKGMAKKGKLKGHHILNAVKKGWITEDQAEELTLIILENEGD